MQELAGLNHEAALQTKSETFNAFDHRRLSPSIATDNHPAGTDFDNPTQADKTALESVDLDRA